MLVNVANVFMVHSTGPSLAELKEYRNGTHIQVVPQKRSHDDAVPGRLRDAPGNQRAIYNDMVPIIWSAMSKNLDQVDLKIASFARMSQKLQEARRDPRQYLAAHGAPDLSDIKDLTEPESPTIVRAPANRAETRSPQKRIARLTSPLKRGCKRIADTIVKLKPGSSPKASPSPRKSPSGPTTPRLSSPTTPITATAPALPSSPLTKSVLKAPEALSPVLTTASPGRTFKVPSYIDSSSITSEHQSPAPQFSSPVKYARPVAPTPSRWNREEPSTPQMSTSAPATPRTGESTTNETPAGLASVILPSTPKPVTFKFDPNQDMSSFDFGTVSPSFHGASWMNSSIDANESRRISSSISRARRVSHSGRRRQSEPLLRKSFKIRARRQSVSPTKLVYPHDESTPAKLVFRHDASSPTKLIYRHDVSYLDEITLPTLFNEDLHEVSAVAKTELADDTIPATTEPVDEPIPTAANATASMNESTPMDISESVDSTITAVTAEAVEEPTPISADEPIAEPLWMNVTKPMDATLVVSWPLSTDSPEYLEEIIPTAAIKHTIPPNEHRVEETTFSTALDTMIPAESHVDSHATTNEHGVLNIDMRENPDIFGAQVSSPPTSGYASINQLAQMAENCCDGQAKVVVTQDNGRLFVRFKLPTEYAHMFPESQGFNESHFSTSPSAISSSPRIRFTTQQASGAFDQSTMSLQDGDAHSTSLSSLTVLENTPSLEHDAQSPTAHGEESTETPSKNIASDASSVSVLDTTPSISALGIFSVSQPGQLDTPSQNERVSMSPVKRTPTVYTPEVSQIDSCSSTLFTHLTPSAQPLSPLERTPQNEDTPVPTARLAPTTKTTTTRSRRSTKSISPAQLTPVEKVQPAIEDTTPTAVSASRLTPVVAATVTPSPRTSFTPVNQSMIQALVGAPSSNQKTTPPTVVNPPASSSPQIHDYDSPGRAYMRDFIRRSRPKRPSTTETGSPIALPTKRLPLEAKSPNAGSPHKTKRKLDTEQNEVSLAKPKEPAAKKARRTPKSTRQKSELEIEMNDHPVIDTIVASPQQAQDADDQEDSAEMDSAPATRRSTRLRSLKGPSSGPKSSIPTAIKMGRSGAGRVAGAVLNSSLRNEHQELANQTRSNTRKNKGNSEYPKQFLAKHAESKGSDSEEVQPQGNTTTKRGKSVVWRDPLESFQEEKPEKSKKAKPTAKTKPTLGKTGIAKPKTTTSQTKRASKMAESLGMVANGTPAKPQRVTRARTRSQA